MMPGNMSHGRAPAFYGHLDNSVMDLENEQGTHVGWMCVHSGKQNRSPRFIASRRCSLTFVASSLGVASNCPKLMILIHQLQCPAERQVS